MTRAPLLISLALATAAAVAPAKPAPVPQGSTAAKPAAAATAEDRTPRYEWRRLGAFDVRSGKMIVAPEMVNPRGLGIGQGC